MLLLAVAVWEAVTLWRCKAGVYKGNVASAKMPDSTMITYLGDMIELAGIADIDPARVEWAVSQGIPVFGDYQEILADKTVDAVLIAAPNHLHKPMAIAALRAGKHVLCEKPVMLSSADLLDVMEEAHRANKVFIPDRTENGMRISSLSGRSMKRSFWAGLLKSGVGSWALEASLETGEARKSSVEA